MLERISYLRTHTGLEGKSSKERVSYLTLQRTASGREIHKQPPSSVEYTGYSAFSCPTKPFPPRALARSKLKKYRGAPPFAKINIIYIVLTNPMGILVR